MRAAVVTGASVGIGRSIAIELAKQDFFVLLLARSEEKLKAVKVEIEAKGGQAAVILVDLLSTDSLKTAMNGIRLNYPTIDLIVNVAGVWHGDNQVYADTNFSDFSEDVVTETLKVGILAPMLIVHALADKMPAGSNVVNISGTFEDGAKGWLPYYVAKRAIEDFTVGLSEELRDREIRVNCISPSDTNTESYAKFFPQFIANAVEPIDIAKQVLSMVSAENKLTGKVILVKKDHPATESFHN